MGLRGRETLGAVLRALRAVQAHHDQVGRLPNLLLSDLPDLPGALCAGQDPEWWFPRRWEPGNGNLAKKICEACPDRAPCLAWAVAQEPAPHGIWGGVSQGSRQDQQRRERREASGAA
jgi:hypothetical protein